MIQTKAEALKVLEVTIEGMNSVAAQEALTYLKTRTVDTSVLSDGFNETNVVRWREGSQEEQ